MSPTACGTSTSSERPRQGSRETIPDTPRPYCRDPEWIKAGVSEGRGAVCCLGGTGWGEALGVQGEGRELHPPPKKPGGVSISQFDVTQLGLREKNVFLGGEREVGFFSPRNGVKK